MHNLCSVYAWTLRVLHANPFMNVSHMIQGSDSKHVSSEEEFVGETLAKKK